MTGKKLLSFNEVTNKEVSTGTKITLRTTWDDERYPDRVLTGEVKEWSDPKIISDKMETSGNHPGIMTTTESTGTKDEDVSDFWTAWLDPSGYWKIDENGVQDETAWLSERHRSTPFDSPSDHPPGIQTRHTDRIMLVVPHPAFESDGYWFYRPAPVGFVTSLVTGISDPPILIDPEEKCNMSN